MLLVAVALQVLFMVGLPLALGAWLVRRRGAKPALIGAGAIAFVGSQVVHIPLLIAVTWLLHRPWMPPVPPRHVALFNAVVLGVAAGACEEPARWLIVTRWQKQARSWLDAMALGTGHGGVESVILGLLAALGAIGQLALRVAGPRALGVPPDHAAQAAHQMHAFFATPWWMPLVGVLERLFAIAFHLSASVLVLRGVVTRRARWLLGAVAWHALTDGVAVYVIRTHGPLWAEVAVAATLPVSLAIIAWGRDALPAGD